MTSANSMNGTRRNQITLWGPPDSGLHEYARKQWSGMLTGFYLPRVGNVPAAAGSGAGRQTGIRRSGFRAGYSRLGGQVDAR